MAATTTRNENAYVTRRAWRELVAECKRWLDAGALDYAAGDELTRKIAVIRDDALAYRFVEAAKHANPSVGKRVDEAYGYHMESVAEGYFADGFYRSHAQEVVRRFGAPACTPHTIARAASSTEDCS